jgi:hypothetical protein
VVLLVVVSGDENSRGRPPISFVHAPTAVTFQPFDVIKLDSFHFVTHGQMAPMMADEDDQNEGGEGEDEGGEGTGLPACDRIRFGTRMSYLVDGRPSCAWHFVCTVHLKASSIYNYFHHRLMAQAYRIYADKQSATKPERQSTVTFHSPRLQFFDRLRNMHMLRDRDPYTVWVVDVEFSPIASAYCIPWSLCIRDAYSDKISAQRA